MLAPQDSLDFHHKTESGYIIQTVLKFLISLSLPPKCWNYKHAQPCLALFMDIPIENLKLLELCIANRTCA